jgi:hypothetical protein
MPKSLTSDLPPEHRAALKAYALRNGGSGSGSSSKPGRLAATPKNPTDRSCGRSATATGRRSCRA